MKVKETQETIRLMTGNGWSVEDAAEFLSNIETMKADIDLSKLATKDDINGLRTYIQWYTGIVSTVIVICTIVIAFIKH